MMTKSMRRRGSVAPLVAVCLVAIIGVMAIAVDAGLLLDARRSVQAGADSASLAAAVDLYEKWSDNQGVDVDGTAKSSAIANALANGFSNDGVQSVVKVGVYPEKYQEGYRKGQVIPKGYVEVSVQQSQKRGFSAIFGSGDLFVRARAVARGFSTSQGAGIICLNPTLYRSLNIRGNGIFDASSSTVIVNSTSTEAAFVGAQSWAAATEFDIAGDVNGRSQFQGIVNTGSLPVADPLASLPPPDPLKLTVRSSSHLKVEATATLQPGVYKGGISISTIDTVTFAPGIYYIDGGGFRIEGRSNVVGNQVMIYNSPASNDSASDGVTISGQGTVTFSPPTSGTYSGLTLFQSRASYQPDIYIAGNGQFSISGTFYAPSAKAAIVGNGDLSLTSQLIVDNLDVSGNGNAVVTYNGKTVRRPDIRLVQ